MFFKGSEGQKKNWLFLARIIAKKTFKIIAISNIFLVSPHVGLEPGKIK